MFDRHGKVMFDMVSKFLIVFCPDWTIRLTSLAFDGARNTTNHVVGIITRLDTAMHDDCPLIWNWFGMHQLDLVMEHIMNDVVKECFFTIMTSFIIHITRQQKLIANMNTTCPRIVNRWLSIEKVTKWFKIHHLKLLAHIESKQPASAPPHFWWASLLVMQNFTSRTTIAFRSIQGLMTLLEQQQAALNDFIASFIDDVGVTGLLIIESIGNLDTSTHVINGLYVVFISSVQEFLSILATWMDALIQEANDVDYNNLCRDIGLVYVTACDQIDSICVHRDHNNNPFVDPTSLPPILPHELIKFTAAQYIRKICQHTFFLEHRYSSIQIDIITDEHKALIHVYQFEQVLKQGIDAMSGKLSFKDGWSLLGAWFPNLMDQCGVVTMLFPGTSTVESYFFVLCWEKDEYRKALSNFRLECVLQSKQYFFIKMPILPTRPTA